MAEIKLTIPDAITPRILDAFDGFYGGRPEETSKAKWAKKWVRQFVRETVRNYEGRSAIEGLRRAAEIAADEATDGIT